MIKKRIVEDCAQFTFEKHDRINVKNVNQIKIKVLRTIVNPKVSCIIIDLTGLDFIDSYAAEVFVTLRKFAWRKRKRFFLRNVSDEFREIIQLLNIEKDFSEWKEN